MTFSFTLTKHRSCVRNLLFLMTISLAHCKIVEEESPWISYDLGEIHDNYYYYCFSMAKRSRNFRVRTALVLSTVAHRTLQENRPSSINRTQCSLPSLIILMAFGIYARISHTYAANGNHYMQSHFHVELSRINHKWKLIMPKMQQ